MTTNISRAHRGAEAVLRHKQIAEDSEDDISDQDVVNLLTDLRHLCDARELDFFFLVKASYATYLEELNGQDEDEI